MHLQTLTQMDREKSKNRTWLQTEHAASPRIHCNFNLSANKRACFTVSLFGQHALNRDFHSVTIIENCNRITFAVTRISACCMVNVCIRFDSVCVCWAAATRRLLTHLTICVRTQTLCSFVAFYVWCGMIALRNCQRQIYIEIDCQVNWE